MPGVAHLARDLPRVGTLLVSCEHRERDGQRAHGWSSSLSAAVDTVDAGVRQAFSFHLMRFMVSLIGYTFAKHTAEKVTPCFFFVFLFFFLI